ncbi:hypothetical protein [Rhizobium yanglingense]
MEDLSAEDCDGIILTAYIDYCIASGRSPIVVGAFIAWFAAVYPSKMGTFFAIEADRFFPNLQGQSREHQIRAARAFLVSPVDRALLDHHGTK